MRSGQTAAMQVGVPGDEPAPAHARYWRSRRPPGLVCELSPSGEPLEHAGRTLATAARCRRRRRGPHPRRLARLWRGSRPARSRGGRLAQGARDVAANALGFRIVAVSLSGQKEVSREEILTTAGVSGRASLLFLDADAARARLMANPWIADAAVLKLYPDRLQITITERQAFALWQKDGHLNVIAADGTVLQPFVEDRYVGLPLVVGTDAARQAKDFLAIIDRYATIRSQLRASILVAERR